MSKKIANQKLSLAARKMRELVESVGGGSQRAFASQVGCSQPVISRILNGQQEPGKDLIEKIAGLKGVDGAELKRAYEESLSGLGEDYQVPIASCLLDGSPLANKEKLTPGSIAVSRTVYSPTVYAVRSRMPTRIQ